MINTKTLLVLGAGASMDYGFPSGQQLLDDILNFSQDNLHKTINTHTSHLGNHKASDIFLASLLCIEMRENRSTQLTFDKCLDIVKEFYELLFNSSAASIDDFLARIQRNKPANWEEMIFIGKLLIVLLISQYQNDNLFSFRNVMYMDEGYSSHRYKKAKFSVVGASPGLNVNEIVHGWYDSLWVKIYEGCKTKDELVVSLENLIVVTFNYEKSLENFLETRIKNMFSCSDEEMAEIVESLFIHHVYGEIKEYSPLKLSLFSKSFNNNFEGTSDIEQSLFDYGQLIERSFDCNSGFSSDSPQQLKDEILKTCSVANGVFTYEEAEDSFLPDIPKFALDELPKVKDVFFLGFGYLEQNIEYLFKAVLLHLPSFNYYGTMYGMGINKMKKSLELMIKHKRHISNISLGPISWLGFNMEPYVKKNSSVEFRDFISGRYPNHGSMKISEFFEESHSIN